MNHKEYLGKKINIVIDRELGSKHPEYGFIYPVNYGYVPDTVSGDGEELDCYLLGVFEPVKTFKGKCIAIIHRVDDDDDKYSAEELSAFLDMDLEEIQGILRLTGEDN